MDDSVFNGLLLPLVAVATWLVVWCLKRFGKLPPEVCSHVVLGLGLAAGLAGHFAGLDAPHALLLASAAGNASLIHGMTSGTKKTVARAKAVRASRLAPKPEAPVDTGSIDERQLRALGEVQRGDKIGRPKPPKKGDS